LLRFAPKKHTDSSQKKAKLHAVIPTEVMRSITQRRNLASNGKIRTIVGQIPRLRSE